MVHWHKKVSLIVICITILTLFPGYSAVQAERLADPPPPVPPVVVTHDETGYASFIGSGEGEDLSLPRGMIQADIQPEMVPALFLDAYGHYFGLDDPLKNTRLMSMDQNEVHYSARYQQLYQGVPVIAGELIVNTTQDMKLQSISGEVSPNLNLIVNPMIMAEIAEKTALGVVAKSQDVPEEDLEATEPELWIYDEQLLRASERPAELVWRMDVKSTSGMPIRELVLINARTGGVSLHFNQVDTLWYDLAHEEDVLGPVMVGGRSILRQLSHDGMCPIQVMT